MDIHRKATAVTILLHGADKPRWRPIILPVYYPHAETEQDLLENFLAIQSEDGSIDGKPGLAGQRGHYPARRPFSPALHGNSMSVRKIKFFSTKSFRN